jgi:dynein assembly factor 5, axonemal
MAQIPEEVINAAQNLQNPERMTRQTALKQILTFCQSDQLTLELAIAVYNEMYLSLLKGYTDKYEMCRSLSGLVVSALLQKLPDNDYYLDCLIPVVARRLGQKELVEESEELRLQLLQQLNEIIVKFTPTERPATEKSDRFLKTYNDVIDILVRCLRDSFPAVQRECCTIIKSYATATTCFHYRAEVLTQPLMEMLKHYQSPVQVAAIEALGEVMLHIHSNADCIAKVLQTLVLITIDPYDTPSVRLGCGRVGCRLLMELRDRYSFFDRILPLVLCCLSDEVPAICQEIEKLWTQVGQQFFLENETELAKFEVVETVPANYPTGHSRPSLGCRALVQRSLKIVKIVINEMEDWKPTVRLRALRLLYQMILHSEKAVAKHFVDINCVLSKMHVDEDTEVNKEALQVARLMAALLDYDSWSGVAIEEFKKFMTVGHLKCICAMYVASGETAAKCGDIRQICFICLDPSICQTGDVSATGVMFV